jgi:predicted metal-dependent peptidase
MLPDNFIEGRKLLLRNYPFYGLPAMATPIEMVDFLPTAATNGTRMYFNPKFLHRMPVPHVAFVIAHESIHVLRADPDMMSRKRWADGSPIASIKLLNIALDHWINLTLKSEGLQPPTTIQICADPKFSGWTVRQIYDHLLAESPEESEEGDGDDDADSEGSSKPGDPSKPGKPGKPGKPKGAGGIGEADDVMVQPLTAEELAEHRIKVRSSAEAARSQGKLPGWADNLIQKQASPKIQFRDLLEAWLHDTFAKDDLSWRRLNRHYLPDFFAPTTCGTTFGNLMIFMDTSGSCWNDAPLFLSLVNKALKQLRPVTTTLQQFDDGLQGPPHIFKPGETLDSSKVKIYGCGGTSFIPCFDSVARGTTQYDGVIMLTDLLGTFPKNPPPYPVLWVSTVAGSKAPFGTTFFLRHGEKDLED